MQTVDIIYYFDTLSSWCYVADTSALAPVRAKYGERVRVEWRIAQLFEGGPLPYPVQGYAWYYRRLEDIAGMHLNASWRRSDQDSTSHANLAVEACRALGVGDDRVRLGIARAAVLEGRPMGERDAVVAVAAELAQLDVVEIDRAMRSPVVAERIYRSSQAFAKMGVEVRPAFDVRNAQGDRAVLSGICTFASLDALVDEMLKTADVTEALGPGPQ